MMGYYIYNDELYHHGILGMHWGIRRFQDKNGRLTNAGKKRYNKGEHKKLTDEQKKAIAVGVGVTAAVAIAAVGGVVLYKNGKLNPVIDRLANKGLDKVHIGSDGNQVNEIINDDVFGIEKQIVKIDGNPELQSKYIKFGFPDINSDSEVVAKIMADSNKKYYNNPNREARENCKENSLTFFMRKGLGKDLVSPLPDGTDDLETFCCQYFEYPFQQNPIMINGEKRYIRKSQITSNIKCNETDKKVDRVKNWIQERLDSGEYHDGDIGALGCEEMGHTISWFIEDNKIHFVNVLQSTSSRSAQQWFTGMEKDFKEVRFNIVNYSTLTPKESLSNLYKT